MGDARGQAYLAIMYRDGNGVQKDYAKAVEYYTLAAEQDNLTALNNLAILYLEGKGVEADETKAMELYTRAAELGEPYAQYNLGFSYFMGKGVEKDYAKAAYWYNECVNNPNADEKIIKEASEQLENPNVKAALK